MPIDWKKKKAALRAKKSDDNSEFETTELEDANAVFLDPKVKRESVSIRLSSEVIHYFKSFGPGYQTKINDVLLQHVRNQPGDGAQTEDSSRDADLVERIGSMVLENVLPLVKNEIGYEIERRLPVRSAVSGVFPPHPAASHATHELVITDHGEMAIQYAGSKEMRRAVLSRPSHLYSSCSLWGFPYLGNSCKTNE